MLSHHNEPPTSEDYEDEQSALIIRRLAQQYEMKTVKMLDDKYIILKTLGEGRYARVKLAVDIHSNKQVAIKFLKVKSGDSRRKALEFFLNEIQILSKCDHPNIVKIIEASFQGVLTQYQYNSDHVRQYYTPSISSSKFLDQDEHIIIQRRSDICYYSMNLAEYGEIFKLIEITDRFSERLARTLFIQLIQGIEYLSANGIAHRDIKPENLLLDKDFRLVIADFGFAIQLQNSGSMDNEYEKLIQKSRIVGSEDYNAPEVVNEEIKNELQLNLIHAQDRNQNLGTSNSIAQDLYDPIKADIFSAAATLFIMVMRSPPFRKANMKDPYFKRLQAPDSKSFWNIFKNIHSSSDFKDMFEKLSKINPDERLNFYQIFYHSWINNSQILTKEELGEEIVKRFEIVEKSISTQTSKHQGSNQQMFQSYADFEIMKKDEQEFQQFRKQSADLVSTISKCLIEKDSQLSIKLPEDNSSQDYQTYHQPQHQSDNKGKPKSNKQLLNPSTDSQNAISSNLESSMKAKLNLHESNEREEQQLDE